MNPPRLGRLAIIGAGLIGSSIARDLAEQGMAGHVTISTRSAETLARAQELGLGDSYVQSAADAVKDAVYARLKLTEPGPGAIHFPRRLDADYFRQLTAERVVTRFERGRPIRSWQPKRDGERNEALDTFVYAHAALHGLISMGMRLNEEVESMRAPQGRPAARPIRSAWMG